MEGLCHGACHLQQYSELSPHLVLTLLHLQTWTGLGKVKTEVLSYCLIWLMKMDSSFIDNYTLVGHLWRYSLHFSLSSHYFNLFVFPSLIFPFCPWYLELFLFYHLYFWCLERNFFVIYMGKSRHPTTSVISQIFSLLFCLCMLPIFLLYNFIFN